MLVRGSIRKDLFSTGERGPLAKESLVSRRRVPGRAAPAVLTCDNDVFRLVTVAEPSLGLFIFSGEFTEVEKSCDELLVRRPWSGCAERTCLS